MASNSTLVFRIGRDLGAHVDSDGSVNGHVLLGAVEHRLPSDRYRTWKAAGTPSLPTYDGEDVREFEDLNFVDGVLEHLAQLQAQGLVRTVDPDSLDSLLSFGASVRLCQVMPFQEVERRMNSTDQPLGAGGRILLGVGPRLYPMLGTAHRHENLASALEVAADDARRQGSTDVLLTAPQVRLGDLVRTTLGTLLQRSAVALEPVGESDE